MKIHRFILFFLLLSFAAQAQKSREIITPNTWSNGYDFVFYVTPEAYKETGYDAADYGKNQFLMYGGNLHEAGVFLWLSEENGKLTVAGKDDYQMFPRGDVVTITADGKHLLFRDKATGALHGVLESLGKKGDWAKHIKQNLLRFALAGNYVDKFGNTIVFSATECKVDGFCGKNCTFTFAELYDTPSLVLIFKNSTYRVVKGLNGLTLTPVKPANDDHDFYEPIKNGDVIELTSSTTKTERRFPLLSTQILTVAQIQTYAGEAENQKEVFATMRNEIFAAHGYIFKTPKWRDLFSQTTWYKPQYSDVSNRLSDIEKINIEHLKLLEK